MDIRHIHIHIIFGPVCCHYYLIVWYIKLNMSFLNQSKNKTIRLIRFRRMSISFWHGGLTGNSWLCVLLCRKQSAIDQYNQFLCEIGKFIDHAGLTSTDHKTVGHFKFSFICIWHLCSFHLCSSWSRWAGQKCCPLLDGSIRLPSHEYFFGDLVTYHKNIKVYFYC